MSQDSSASDDFAEWFREVTDLASRSAWTVGEALSFDPADFVGYYRAGCGTVSALFYYAEDNERD